MFFCRFAFFFFYFFSPAKFSQPPLDRFAPNLARICLHALGRKAQKPGYNGQKTSKNRSIFHTRRHVFARCDETVKAEKSFLR